MTYSCAAYSIMPQWNISAFLAHHSYLLSATAIVFLAGCHLFKGKLPVKVHRAHYPLSVSSGL